MEIQTTYTSARCNISYGWVVTGASLFITTTSFGVFWSFGIFLKAWLTDLSSSRAFLSGIFSVTFLSYGLASIVTGSLSDRYGPRKTLAVGGLIMSAGCVLTARCDNVWLIYLTWGIMVGIGAGTAYSPTASTVSRWFLNRKGLALGIIVSGLGLGTLIFSPLTESLIDHLGWRGAAISLGIITFIVYLIGVLLIRRAPRDLGPDPSICKKEGLGNYTGTRSNEISRSEVFSSLDLKKALRTKIFWILFTIHGLWLLGLSMTMVHFVPYATDIGIAINRAANMLAVLGGMSVAGRVVLGVLTERIGIRASLAALLCFQMGTMFWLMASCKCY